MEEGDVEDMIKEILISLLSVSTLVGIITFIVRQGIWTRYIQPLVSHKPKLSIRFENGLDVLNLEKANPRDVEKAVVEVMTKEQQKHPYMHYAEPSFNNPFPQLFEGDSTNKKIYNKQLGEYLKEKEKEVRNIEIGLIEDEFMKPVKLVLRNDGKVGSGKLNIHLMIEPNEHVFCADNRDYLNGETIEPPVFIPDGALPFLDYKCISYTY